MDGQLATLFSWQALLLALAIYFITYTVRTVIEATVKGVSTQGTKLFLVWRELFLPLGPMGTGILLAFYATKFPWPPIIANSMSAKILYGLVTGGCSGFVYGRFRVWSGVLLTSPSSLFAPPPLPPPPPPEVVVVTSTAQVK